MSAGQGHNNPPHDSELARERADALIANANRWAAERPKIADAETAAKCADFLDQLDAELKSLDAQRKAEKKPYLDAGKAVDQRWQPLLGAIEACKKLLYPLHGAWLRREQQRIYAERQAKQREAAEARSAALEVAEGASRPNATVEAILAAEAAEQKADEAAAAAAALPERAQVRGNLTGRLRSLRTTWHAVIVDLDKAMRHYRQRTELRELIERLAAADARAGVRELPGCRVYSTQE